MNANHAYRALLLIAGALALAGCGAYGHGRHTSEGLAQAQARMSALKAGTEWDRARQQYISGDLKKALDSVESSIEINPSVPKSHTLKGRILIELGRLESAAESFQKALAIDPAFVDAHYYLGIVYERFSKYEDALTEYQAAFSLEQNSAQYAVAAAEMMIELGRLEQAQRLMETLRGAFEHNAGVRQTLGHIAMLQDEPHEAAALFQEARLLAPDDSSISEDLAVALVAAEREAEAEHLLRRLLEEQEYKGRRDLKRLRASCLTALDRPVEARAVLLGLTSGDEGASDVQSWIDLGNIAVMLGDMTRARIAASRVMALAPERPEGYVLAAVWRRDRGETDKALALLDKAVAAARGDAAPAAMRGVMLRELGRHDAARESFMDALAADPNDQRVQRLLAGVDDSR